jgi:hypothetical protein
MILGFFIFIKLKVSCFLLVYLKLYRIFSLALFFYFLNKKKSKIRILRISRTEKKQKTLRLMIHKLVFVFLLVLFLLRNIFELLFCCNL